jgi:hypothetical protein
MLQINTPVQFVYRSACGNAFGPQSSRIQIGE